MTEPAPDTGTETQPDTGSSAPEPEPTSTEPPPQPDTGPDLQAEVDKWKALARKHETTAKKNKQQLDELATKANGEPSAEELQTRLSEADTAREEAEARAVELAYENTVSRVAGKVGADAEALLDSAGFRDAVAEELDDDFDDNDLTKAVEKVAKEFAKKPRFAGQRAPARSGADITGGPGGVRQLTNDDLARMSPEQIVAAQEKGQLNGLLGIT